MFEKQHEVSGKAYLYSIWSGRFTIREGYVCSSCSKSPKDEIGYFILNTGEKCAQSIHPGVVYNGMVWLTENDPNKAINLLIKNKQEKIECLRFKIDNCMNNIALLEVSRLVY